MAMIIGVSGVVKKVGRHDSGIWYVQIQVTSRFIQTYTGFTKRPKLTVGQKVKKGDEI